MRISFLLFMVFLIPINCFSNENYYRDFSPVIKDSNLQCYERDYKNFPSKELSGRDLPSGIKKQFYISASGSLVIKHSKNQQGIKNRCELRQRSGEWDVSSDIAHTLKARFNLLNTQGLQEITLMQIHMKCEEKECDIENKPLLRIAWVKNKKGYNNHLWAVIRTEVAQKNRKGKDNPYEWIDLGIMSRSTQLIEISSRNNELVVALNEHEKVRKDVSYWQGIKNHFKTGLYLNSESDVGQATIEYKSLEYITGNNVDISFQHPIAEHPNNNNWSAEFQSAYLADGKGGGEVVLSPKVIWKGDNWRWQFQQDIPVEKDSSKGRFQIKSSWLNGGFFTGTDIDDITVNDERQEPASRIDGKKPHYWILYNEANYSTDKKTWSGQVAPSVFKVVSEYQDNQGRHIENKVGSIFEIDYLKDDHWGIQRVGIKPTLTRRWLSEGTDFKLSLEAPAFRVMINDDKKDDFALESAKLTASYRTPILGEKNLHFKTVVELPYDLEKHELREKLFLDLQYDF